jgi:hypothetical protein
MFARSLGWALQLFVAGLLLVGPAKASTIITPSPAFADLSAPGQVFTAFGSVNPNTAVNDTYDFHLTVANLGALTTAIALNSNPPQQGGFGIANLTITWLNGVTQFAQLVVTDAAGVVINTSAKLLFALTGPNNDLHVKVTGTGLGSGGGYILNVSTVPLPPALLLFGSGLLGLTLLGRRRRRSSGPGLVG